MDGGPERGWALPCAEVALATGYADQAHLTRDFVSFAGVTPVAYRHASRTNHLPVPGSVA